jgi:transposase
MEASKEKRDEYLNELKKIDRSNIVYIDESGIDISEVKDRGWGKKDKRLRGQKSGKYYQRINIVAGYINNNSIAPMIFESSCDTQLFERWVEEFLIKELKVGQVVILDNATFHKSQKVRSLIEAVKCKIIFLPPYSPDLNPIEKFWANMKRWIRDNMNIFETIYDAISAYFNMPTST